ncbi:MAG: penicillin acylase family protein [Deltaproteobacteria bacterium]|nr:penicillin acylase family protein [Deltaproteobacteria bacterium]
MSNRAMHQAKRAVYSALVGVLALGLLGASPNQKIDQQATYEASVQRTQGGIPHIAAADFASMGFGTGYAMAQDILCLLADDRFLTFSAERSKFLGEGGGNLQSDYFYQLFIDRGEAEEPVDPRQAGVFRGAAAGYNRYLRDTPVAERDATCGAESYVREVAEIDWRRISRMDFFLPFVAGLITAAQPPPPPTAALKKATPPQTLSAEQHREIQVAWNEMVEPFREEGSNGIGLGRDATVDGTGMLLANPHQGWDGVSRFYAFHQMLPGELNIVGANVIGRPQVGFGTTEKVAWTSTVSTADRFTFFQLFLNPANPLQYIFDDVPMDMIQETVTVQVPDGNGGFEDRTHTFYSTHFGAFLVGGFFPWNQFTAFAVRPAGNTGPGGAGWRGINSLLDSYQATTVRELKAVHDAGQFLPVNLVAADSSGEAVYADPGPIPNLTAEQTALCSPFGTVLGNSTFCQWRDDPDAAAPGIFGPSNLPELFRTDYVTNSNDSYWLTNPAEPITGVDPILGSVGSERELRTRGGLTLVQSRIAGTDGQAGSKFTLAQLQGLMLGNDAYSGEILRDGLVALCVANPTVTLPDTTMVDISPACPVLAAWDLHDNLDSEGAHLFREFMNAGDGGRTLPSSWNYVAPYNLADPVNTPTGLDPVNNPAALQALAEAVQLLNDAGIALDAKLGDLQSEPRGAVQIPMHGGTNASGLFNIIGASFQGAAGYPNVTSGSSWMQATEFTANGPVSRGILAYSLSPNSDSPHYADQTLLFSQKQWVDLPFTAEEVDAAAESSLDLSEGKSDCKKGGWQAFTNPVFSNQGECVEYYNALRQQRLAEIKARY